MTDRDAQNVARLAREVDSRARAMKTQRAHIRRMEAAIRLHSTGRCTCATHQECLARLYRLVPTEPRR